MGCGELSCSCRPRTRVLASEAKTESTTHAGLCEPRLAVTCLAMPVRHVVCEFHLRVCEKMFWRKDRSCLGTSEGRALILVPTHRNRDCPEVAISGKRRTIPI